MVVGPRFDPAVYKAGVITTATRRLAALKCCGQTEPDDLRETGTSTNCSINETSCNDLSGTDHSKTSKQTKRLLLHGMFSLYRSATIYCTRTAISEYLCGFRNHQQSKRRHSCLNTERDIWEDGGKWSATCSGLLIYKERSQDNHCIEEISKGKR